MNETKKLMIIGVIGIVIVALIPIIAIVTNIKSKKIIQDFHNYIDSKEAKLIYIGRDDCGYCQLFSPELDLISDEYGIDYMYINTNKLKSNHFTNLLKELDVDTENFGTPYIAIFKDGKKVADQSGYLSDESLFEYLKTQKMIGEDEQLPLTYIDYDKYNELINSSTKQLIVIGQSGCEGCTKAKPILYDIASEYGVKINYLNATSLDEETATNFQSSLDYFTENGISTPLMLVVSNKKVEDALVGSADKNTYIEFLKKNSFINE